MNRSMPGSEGTLDRARVVERYRPAFEASPTPLLLIADDGKILMSNEQVDQLFGYEPNELVGQRIEILVPEDVRNHHPDLRDAFFEYPEARQMGTGRDLYGVSKHGNQIPVEIGLTPQQFDGRTLVLASVLDITERKRQEARFRMAVDAAASAIVMLNVEGRIELVNRQAEEMFGYTAEELLGKPVEMLIPERLRRKHTVYRSSYVRQPVRRPMGRGHDLYGRRHDASEFPVEIGLTPIESRDGHFVMATVIDITERKRSEAEIRQKNEQLSRLNEELSQFAYSASHDLKAPLATIQGLVGVLEDDLKEGKAQEVVEVVRRIRKLTEELSTLIEDMLALARTDHDHEPVSEVKLRQLVTQTFAKVEAQAHHSGVRLDADKVPEITVATEPRRLTQVIDNLVVNAVKYADPQKPERYVAVGAEAHADRLRVWVADNGLGIPKDFHGDVFKMFHRFHPKISGSGVGLALVHKHVQRLQGEIRFETSEAGTTFSVTLPYQALKADA